MAKLKDIQNSQQSEIKDQQAQAEHRNLAEDIRKNGGGDKKVRPQDGWRIYKLVNMRKGKTVVDGCSDFAKNPKTGKPERIYLINGAPSIWSTELVELLKDKSYLSINKRSLEFDNGILRVPEYDTLAIEFIENCHLYIESPNKRSGSYFEFFEYNPQKMEEARIKREELEIEMAIAAKQMDLQKAKRLASFLGISMYDNDGLPIGDTGVRSALMRYAKNNPETFQKHLDSKEVDISYMVKQAILDSLIDIADGSISWSAGGFITRHGNKKALDVLMELATSPTEEGKVFLETLTKKMSKA